MLPFDRLYYNSAAIFAGPSPATGVNTPLNQINRPKSFNYNVDVKRTDVNILGKLGRLSAEIIDAPTVGVNFECDDVNANNESYFGFIVDGSVSFASGLINGTTDDRNLFVLWAPNGEDAVGNVSASNTFAAQGFGNCFINSYSCKGAVGAIPTNSFAFECLNYAAYLDITGQASPAINPQNGVPIAGELWSIGSVVTGNGASALRPGDITVSITSDGITGIGTVISQSRIQSYDITTSLAREDLKELGTRFSVGKKIKFPAEITCAIAMEPSVFQTGSLSTMLCQDSNYTIVITLGKPVCPGASPVTAKIYTLQGMKYGSENGGIQIGSNSTLQLNFNTQVTDFQDINFGMRISGLLE